MLKKLLKQLAIIFVHWWSHKNINLWKDLMMSWSTFKYRRPLSRPFPRAVSPSVTLPSISEVLLSICLLALPSVYVQMTEEAEDLNTILRQRSWSKIHYYQKYSASKSQDKLLNRFLITSCAGISWDGKWLRSDLLITVFVSVLQLQMPSLWVVPFLAGSCRNILSSKVKTSSSSQNQRNPSQTFLSML